MSDWKKPPERCDYCRWSLELHHPDCLERKKLASERIPEGSISAPKLQDGPGAWALPPSAPPPIPEGLGREPGMIDPEDGGIWLQPDSGFRRRAVAGRVLIRLEYLRAAQAKGWELAPYPADFKRQSRMIAVERRG